VNTRRHPRTLREAFPRDAEYACAVERPESTGRALREILSVVGAAFVAVLCVHVFFTFFGSIWE